MTRYVVDCMENVNSSRKLPPNWVDMSHVERLRFTIARYKEHDKKRKRYILNLMDEIENAKKRVKQLELLTERQHNEIDELIDAQENAKPLIANPNQKACVYKLLQRIEHLKPFASLYNKAMERCDRQELRIKELEELVKALQENIKTLHKIQNGNK